MPRMGWVAIPVANLQVYIHYISTVDYIYIYHAGSELQGKCGNFLYHDGFEVPCQIEEQH